MRLHALSLQMASSALTASSKALARELSASRRKARGIEQNSFATSAAEDVAAGGSGAGPAAQAQKAAQASPKKGRRRPAAPGKLSLAAAEASSRLALFAGALRRHWIRLGPRLRAFSRLICF